MFRFWILFFFFPSFLMASDMSGLFYAVVWILEGYLSLYYLLTGLLILFLRKKKFHSSISKFFVNLFFYSGLLVGGGLLLLLAGVIYDSFLNLETSLLTFLLLALCITIGGFQISQSLKFKKESKKNLQS